MFDTSNISKVPCFYHIKVTELSTVFLTSSDNSVFNKFQVSLVSISITVRKSRYTEP